MRALPSPLNSSGGGSRGALSCTISCVTIRNFRARAELLALEYPFG